MSKTLCINRCTALYELRSKDNDLQGESNSIGILVEYARQNGFVPLKHYTDDGDTG